MKALSLRQPWAEWVIQGRKTLELRTWGTDYRGPLAIHASKSTNLEACLHAGLDPRGLASGAVLGTVELVDILALDEPTLAARAHEHLASGFARPPLKGWVLANPRRLAQPVPFPGRMSLFEVPDALLEAAAAPLVYPPPALDGWPEERPAGQHVEESLGLDSRLPFELHVLPEPPAVPSAPAYRLALYQRPVEAPPQQPGLLGLGFIAPPRMRQVIELSGTNLRAVSDVILEALRQNGYAATDLGAARRQPFFLSEETGVRLALLFLAVRPITRLDRVEAISRGLRSMTGEELYYWFSKCTVGPALERAQKALRLLLAEE